MNARRASGLEIAIVGMAARFPGAADVDAYWRLLLESREGIRHFSDAELRASGVGEERLGDPSLVRSLGLLDEVDRFDADFFGYSASDAEILDPQQRLFLEHAWAALENAGHAPDKFDGAIGIFAGSGLGTYTLKLVASGWLAHKQVGFQKIVGNDKDHLATTAAYKLGATGPAVSVQTTCSTSLVAVHLACRSLLAGECDLALAGGVTAGLEASSVFNHQEGNILSKDGRCRPFDAQASGTVVSNGVGLVALRRLDDAIRSGDRVHAVILASAINNDGSLKVGYMSPSVAGQYKVVRRALQLAGVQADSIGFVEAHGTATLKGDPIEVRALTRAYREHTERSGYCALGSVKGNLGHTDTAAGVAGLIKATLALEHATIPATLHFRTPNPELELDASPFHVNAAPLAWPAAAAPRRAAVSSFGLGGTNAHLILEQAPMPVAAQPPADEEQLVMLSARTPPALAVLAARLAEHLRNDESVALRDVAFTLRYGRSDLAERAYFVGARAQVLQALEAPASAAVLVDAAATAAPAWLIDGTPAQWLELVRAYHAGSALFREFAATHANAFAAAGIPSTSLLAPPPGAPAAETSGVHDALVRFAAGYLLGAFLLRYGIDVQAIVARGRDELIAACVAGALTFADGVRIVRFLHGQPAQAAVDAQASDPADALAATLALGTPRVRYLSSIGAGWIASARADARAYWRDLLRALQVPPGATDASPLSGFCVLHTAPLEASEAGAAASPSLHLSLSADRPAAHYRQLLGVAGELWRRGHALHRAPRGAAADGRRVALPPYPFERKRYWADTDMLASPARAPLATAAAEAGAPLLYVPAWRECASAATAVSAAQAGRVLVLAAEGDALAQAFLADLTAAGASATLAHDGSGESGDGSPFVLDGTQRAEYLRLLRSLPEGEKRIVIFESYIERLRPRFAEAGPGAWFLVPMLLAQALGDAMLDGTRDVQAWPTTRLALVTRGMWSVGDDAPGAAEKALARALGTVLAQEYPRLHFRSIDLAADDGAASAAGPKRRRLYDELLHDAAPAQMALRGRRRWERRFERVTEASVGSAPLREGGVYFIGGGLGGIGLEIADYLARDYRARLVLAARSSLPADSTWTARLQRGEGSDDERALLARLLRLRECGGEVLVVQADVADADSVRAARRLAEQRFGHIDGVIHAAGAMPDGIVQRMSEASAWQVLRAKVAGAHVLADTFADASCDFLVLFSSLRALIGGAGNGDYAAANAYLDALAEAVPVDAGLRVRSFNWDGWAGVGMSTRVKHAPHDAPAEAAPIRAADGVRAFALALSLPQAQVAIAASDVDALIAQAASATQEPAWAERRAAVAAAGTRPRPDTLAAPYLAARGDHESALVRLWEQFLGFAPIGVLDSFFALGGDSVTSLQIAAKANEAGLRVGPFDALEMETIAALCERLAAQADAATTRDDAPVSGEVPLTPIQRWFFERDLADPDHFNQAFLLRSVQRLDGAALGAAFAALVAHHDALRSAFRRGADGWEQHQLEEAAPAVFVTEDLGGFAPAARAARVHECAAAVQASLDLAGGAVVKAVFFDGGDAADDRLLICAHHLVVDAISWRVLMDDLQSSYEQALRGVSIRLPAKSAAYKRWAEHLRDYAQNFPVAAAREYWVRTLSAGRHRVPRDRATGDDTIASTASLHREIDLVGLSASAHGRATPLAVLLTALGSALGEWMGEGSLLVDLEGHGRTGGAAGLDLSRTVGWFTALYPFAIPARGDRSDAQAIAAVQAALDAVPNQGLDYGVLAYLCDDLIRYGTQPEVLVLFLGQGGQGTAEGALFELAPESPGLTQNARNRRSHALEIIARMVDSKLSLNVAFSSAIHDSATIDRLLDSFASFYRSCARADAKSEPTAMDEIA